MADLFNWTPPPKYPDAPGFKERTTSKDAADAIAPSAAGLREMVLNVLKRVGPSGYSADQIASGLRMSVLAIRPRVSELHKTGLICKTGERRANVSGQNAHVWRIK